MKPGRPLILDAAAYAAAVAGCDPTTFWGAHSAGRPPTELGASGPPELIGAGRDRAT